MIRLVSTNCVRGKAAKFWATSARSRSPKLNVALRSDYNKRLVSPVSASLSVQYFSTASESEAVSDASVYTSTGLLSLLTAEERELLEEQRALVQRAREIAAQSNVSINQYLPTFLDDLVDETTFSIVVAGEFNAGKSTLINALLGKKVLESGALPTTDSITIVTHEQNQQQQVTSENNQENGNETANNSNSKLEEFHVKSSNGTASAAGVIVHHVPNVSLLEDLTLVDTPGTNAVLADHTARTLRLLPTADLILFVTSADRPFPESERTLLSSIQAYRKSIVVVVNKMDILETSGGSFGNEEKQRVVDFVTEHASELLGGRPVVIPVSSRDALSTKIMGRKSDTNKKSSNQDKNKDNNSKESNPNIPSNQVWERSNFETLESFLRDSLTMETKIKTKLTNPIGQAEGMITAGLQSLHKEQEDLELDIATIKLLHSQSAAWKKEMDAQMLNFRNEVSALLQIEGTRCTILINRLGVLPFYKLTLLGGSKELEAEYDNTKPNFSSRKSLKADLLDHVEETADSIATRGRAQGQQLIEFLGKRPAVKSQSLVGSVSAASRFEDTRNMLVENMAGAVQTHVPDFGEDVEKQELLGSLQQVAYLSAGLSIGSVASGVATAAQLVDMTMGMGLSTVLAASGGMAFSQGRRSIRQSHKAAWKQREDRLDEALQAICSRELSRVERRILDGVAPYTRFVETEKERLDSLVLASEDILAQAHALRSRINKLK